MTTHSQTEGTPEPGERTALVTGGGSGIGRSIALALAERDMDVLVVGRREDALAATASHSRRIRHLVADIGRPEDVDEAVRVAADRGGRVDVVVNNAGVLLPGPLERTERDAALQTWTTNVLGPTLLARAALAYLRASRGSIVNVSSVFGTKPAPGIGQYGASKAALEQLTRSWALELADDGVRVNAVAPGPAESEALERTGMSPAEVERVKDEERRTIPLRRRGDPAEVALWVAHLCDPAAAWTTGQVIGVDGGYGLA